MNTGYKCEKCNSKQVDAYLIKLGNNLTIVLNCRKCKTTEDINVTSFGFELFSPVCNNSDEK